MTALRHLIGWLLLAMPVFMFAAEVLIEGWVFALLSLALLLSLVVSAIAGCLRGSRVSGFDL